MRKPLAAIALIIILAITSGNASAAGSVTQDLKIYDNFAVLVFTCTGDAANGTIPDTDVDESYIAKLRKGYYTFRLIIESLAADAAVTANSDIYLKDSGGTDILGGQGVDALDDSTRNYIQMNEYEPVVDQLTLSAANQAGASGKWYVTVIFVR